ncbi:hypothetical protein QCA50_006496 [Cerrena zonata]|uniref:Uncharacterized protein n=1 Tax=Cerrena zonata TaxID=2478898 RepID=A0AAW0GBM5_9APHY
MTTAFSDDSPSLDANNITRQARKLEDDLNSIHQSFSELSYIIQVMLDHRLPSRCRYEVERLQECWYSIQNKFHDILWSSRSCAGSARQIVEDFICFLDGVILQPGLDNQSKMEEINRYYNLLQSHLEKKNILSKSVTNRLRDLVFEVNAFMNDWKATIQSSRLFRFLIPLIGCSLQLEEAEKSIQRLKYKMLALRFALVAAIGSVAVNGMMSFLRGSYQTELSMARDLYCRLTTLLNDFAEVKSEVAQAKYRRHQLLNDIGLSQIQNVATKIAAFQGVWNEIAVELRSLHNQLDLICTDDQESNSLDNSTSLC